MADTLALGANGRKAVKVQVLSPAPIKMKKYNVFISWSGERSKLIAEAFREWLPMVIQSVKPWMSNTDIDKGSRGLAEIAKALDGIKVGISCLTPENVSAPWILYEAGALSKTIDESARLCTYLLGGLKKQDIKPPLGQFQHTLPEKDETLHLVRTINKAVGGDDALPENTLEPIFETLWPRLEVKLNAFPPAPRGVITPRPIEDMIAEILEFTRSETNRRSTRFMFSDVNGQLVSLAQLRGDLGSTLLGWNQADDAPIFTSNALRNAVQTTPHVIPPKDDDGEEND
jgi:hypothetical protein